MVYLKSRRQSTNISFQKCNIFVTSLLDNVKVSIHSFSFRRLVFQNENVISKILFLYQFIINDVAVVVVVAVAVVA
jgi:hypothetical protein